MQAVVAAGPLFLFVFKEAYVYFSINSDSVTSFESGSDLTGTLTCTWTQLSMQYLVSRSSISSDPRA